MYPKFAGEMGGRFLRTVHTWPENFENAALNYFCG